MIGIATVLLVTVGADPAPGGPPPSFRGEVPGHVRSAYAGETVTERFRVVGREADRIEIAAEGLPAGAVLRDEGTLARAEDGAAAGGALREVSLVWTPTRAQRGLHRVTLVASEGGARRTLEVQIAVEERWESWLLPGVQYVAYFPAGPGEGAFHGPAFELVIGSWVHDTRERGPSHGRVYLDLALLEATQAGRSAGVSYALGLDLSLERNPRRSFLIPVFGMEIGGIQQAQVGGVFQTVPFLGAHLWSDRNLFVTATAGYVFPGREVERFSGWRVRAGLDFALW